MTTPNSNSKRASVNATGFTRQTRDGKWRATVVFEGQEFVGPVMESSIDAEHAALHVFVRTIRPAAVNLSRVLDFSACACSPAVQP